MYTIENQQKAPLLF